MTARLGGRAIRYWSVADTPLFLSDEPVCWKNYEGRLGLTQYDERYDSHKMGLR